MAAAQRVLSSRLDVLVRAGRDDHTHGAMKLDSKYFDMIRINRRSSADKAEEVAASVPCCQWKGCTNSGRYRAPKGRGKDGEYFSFCVEHVRQYNSAYNYFDGMSAEQVSEFQNGIIYGHRPTWKAGANAWSHGTHQGMSAADVSAFARAKAANSAAFAAWRTKQAGEQRASRTYQRGLKPLERKALETLGLTEAATKDDIKARFKEQVKRHHPDANGGQRSSEDRLREIIQAYNYLKQAGLA